MPHLEFPSPEPPMLDWLPDTTSRRVLSSRAREVLEAVAGADDHLQWLPADVVTPDGAHVRYWVMHFTETPDIYDRERTDFGPSGLPMRWVVSRSKVVGRRIFAPPFLGEVFVVDDGVRAAIDAAALTGFASRSCWVAYASCRRSPHPAASDPARVSPSRTSRSSA